ncbi:MAG: galactonate dehydratase [Gammaproteobacteria bacterium]|nr:galactonate dehydratase [Gammaproteobacteria bacterium]
MQRRQFLRQSVAAAVCAATASLPFITNDALAANHAKARQLGLKITDVRTIVMDAGGDENYVFVKIYTNQGMTGLGEGTLPSKGLTMSQAILEHKRYLVGQDPTEIERHWQAMFRGPRYRGGPILMSAISAIDIALWDIFGKALDLPVWQLLGGKARDRVRVYIKPGWGDSPEEMGELWLAAKKAGWTAGKSGFFEPENNVMRQSRALADSVARVRAIRDAVGDDFDICIDLHGKPTTALAVEFCRQVEDYRPYFVEEATQAEDLGELRHLRTHSRVPLATGERLFTKYAFGEICAQHLVDYVQPDVIHCGGITEMRKIAAMADAFRIEVLPHNPNSRLCTFASLHFCAATPNATLLEISGSERDHWDDLFFGAAVDYRDGFAQLPDRPGLGIDLDESVALKSPYVEKDWHGPRFEDGAITDR